MTESVVARDYSESCKFKLNGEPFNSAQLEEWTYGGLPKCDLLFYIRETDTRIIWKKGTGEIIAC